MGTIFLLVLALVLFSTMYFMGKTFGGTQAKKNRDFVVAFGRSLIVLVITTILFFVPIYIATALSYQAHPMAFQQAYMDYGLINSIFDSFFGIFEVFAMLGIPFLIGLWRRYKTLRVRTVGA